MILFLRALFIFILAAMTWGTLRASFAQALFDIPPEVYRNPWFQVTLLDAYFAFLTFFVWVAWKETRSVTRVLWGVAIVLWGNFAMAAYLLRELFRVPTQGSLAEVFASRRDSGLAWPSAFVALGVAVYLLGAKNLLFPAS
jgi:predicted permease